MNNPFLSALTVSVIGLVGGICVGWFYEHKPVISFVMVLVTAIAGVIAELLFLLLGGSLGAVYALKVIFLASLCLSAAVGMLLQLCFRNKQRRPFDTRF